MADGFKVAPTRWIKDKNRSDAMHVTHILWPICGGLGSSAVWTFESTIWRSELTTGH